MRISERLARNGFWSMALMVVVIATVLRLWNLDQLPPSLYWEEWAIGYDAYSLVQTGQDHHGQAWPVVAFTSFGDYKPSGYFYAVMPAVAILGLSEWAVRLPSALAGVGLVIVVGLLAREVAQILWGKHQRLTQLLAMTLTTFSPWAIQFSRGGWEVNFATFLTGLGMLFGLLWLRRSSFATQYQISPLWLVGMVLCLAASMYTYHATRLLAPGLVVVFGIAATIVLPKSIRRRIWIHGFFAMTLFILLMLPLLLASLTSVVGQRFAETSLFGDGWAVEQSNTVRAMTGNSFISRLFFHRWWFMVGQFASNFIQHFSPKFLLLTGDANWRHSTQFTGLLFPIEVTGVIIATAVGFKKKSWIVLLLLAWIMGGIVPAGITKAAPHALRILPTMPAVLALASIGVIEAFMWLQFRTRQFGTNTSRAILVSVVLGVSVLSVGIFVRYWRTYTSLYPILSASEWQDGARPMMQWLGEYVVAHPGERVFVSREQGRPAMAYWFYNHIAPQRVQALEPTAKHDQGEFLEFENLTFIRSGDEAKNGLIVVSEAEYQRLQKQNRIVTEPLVVIKNRAGKIVWIAAQIN